MFTSNEIPLFVTDLFSLHFDFMLKLKNKFYNTRVRLAHFMGLLSKAATAIDWLETKAHSEDIKKDGITQLINQYAKYFNKKIEERSWGYEVIYFFILFIIFNTCFYLSSYRLNIFYWKSLMNQFMFLQEPMKF